MQSILRYFQTVIFLAVVVLFTTGCDNVYVASLDHNPWHPVTVNAQSTLLDLDFTTDLRHGWMVGKQSAVLESQDGGETWNPYPLDLGDQTFTFNSVSFAGNEGWIVGAPSILLHTIDGGMAWERVPLSNQLPGFPNTVLALGPQSAEMTTDVGAIYRTEDGGMNWKAMVQEAVGVVRNIGRSPDGKYVAVSARGNFYSTWSPGQAAWTQHNRTSSRRLQNMGFGADNQLWLIARGGNVQFTESNSLENWLEPINPEFATSWGLLDLAYRTPTEVWLTGGSGNLLLSQDGGQTWLKDRDVEQISGNFYKVTFINEELGFVLGQDGVLLKYEPLTDGQTT